MISFSVPLLTIFTIVFLKAKSNCLFKGISKLSSILSFEGVTSTTGCSSSSLTILNKTGGNIVAVFSSIERTLFDKKKLEEDLKNSTGASNLIVKVLMAVPFIFVLIIYILSPTYFNPLFESTLGYFLIFIIVIMFSICIYLLNKIMKVRV